MAWHMHEMLYGYVPAAVSGFLLTAIPNWTGRPGLKGAPLAALFGLWLAGRLAMLTAPGAVAAHLVALAYLPVLSLIAGREIVLAGNRRNLVVIGLVLALALGETLFFFVNAELGLNLGFAATFLLMMLIGGRVTPAFSRNWLMQRRETRLPRGFGRVDQAAMVLTVLTLVLWLTLPSSTVTGLSATAAAVALVLRMARWRGLAVAREPLMLALHAGYLWLPVSLALLALSILTDAASAAQVRHAMGAGAIGAMTLIMAYRATLGHAGRPIVGGTAEWAMLGAVHLGAAVRVAAEWSPDPGLFYTIAGLLWAAGFALFCWRILPIVLAPRL
jgi:uncharacterized protein involved in response to NO